MDTAPGVGGPRVTATVPLLLLNPTPSMAATSTTSTILAFDHSKHLLKFLSLLVCSPKGAKDILFPWLSDYLNEHYPSKHHSNATAPKKPSSQALFNSTNDQFQLFLMITHRRGTKFRKNTFSRTQRHRVYGKMETTWLHFTTSPTFNAYCLFCPKLLKWFMISYFLCLRGLQSQALLCFLTASILKQGPQSHSALFCVVSYMT